MSGKYWFAHRMPRGEYPPGAYPAAYPVAWQGVALVFAIIFAPIMLIFALLPVLFRLPDWAIAAVLIALVGVSLGIGLRIAMAKTDPVQTMFDYKEQRAAKRGSGSH
jgi:hypothetical protein